MTGVASISVHIPTFQGAEFLERLLARLAEQRLDRPWDLHVVDSGSTDRTLAILERARENFPVPLALSGIHPLEFDHGDTRNALAAHSQGELAVFLTQDAIPGDERWLAKLARNFDDPAVAAAYCRNVPRPGASILARSACAEDLGYAAGRREVRLPDEAEYVRLDPHARRLLYNFNDVASAVRRSIWRRHPFPRTSFGEDLLLARALLEAGHTLVYDVDAWVEHSHDYDAAQLRARAVIDGRFNAEWLDRVCVASLADARTLAERQLERDRAALVREGLAGAQLEREHARAGELRRATFVGLYEGGLARRRRPRTRARERDELALLFVVHGFPPDTWAGTEVYTLELAKELQRLGHRVTILTRAPLTKGAAGEWELARDRFQGLDVLRLPHAVDDQPLGESYAHPRAEEHFARLLDELAPDVVHFQHLIHLSAQLVGIARQRRIATVLTLNDYWGLCARVQLLRPDGVRCEENQGLGCLVCVKDKDFADIPHARAWYPLAEPAVRVAEAVAALPKLPSVKLERLVHKRRIVAGRWARSFRELQRRQDVVLGNYAAADLALAPSRFLREKYLATGRFDPERLVYSDYGMVTENLRALEKRPDPHGRLRLGYVGSLVWHKGIDTLILAMQRLAGEPCVLNVFGDFRPEREPFHRRLAELAQGAGKGVEFRGRFENQRLSEVYREIDVLVVPSIWFENSPLTIHEAWILRTPVVASGIGGMAELVRDGVDGLHFRVGDAADLARTLARFLCDPGLVAQLSRGFPRVKTIAEDAREMEVRYRSLCTLVR